MSASVCGWVLERMAERPYVGIRRRVRPEGIGAALAEILPATAAFLRQRGQAPAGPPACLYLGHDEARGEMELLGGFFLVEPLAAPGGEVEVGSLPAGLVARTLHVGPYDRLGPAHEALRTGLRGQGHEAAFPCWDLFWTDPGEVRDPAAWITEIGQRVG